jgi:hypothetical protein
MSLLKDLFYSIEGDNKVLICAGSNRDYYVTFFPLLYNIPCKHINDTKIIGQKYIENSTPILFLDEVERNNITTDPIFGDLKDVPVIERKGEEIRILVEEFKEEDGNEIPLTEFDTLFELILGA